MEISPRQNLIMSAARSAGRVSVDRLASEFEVSHQTIRKDLNDLCQRGLLSRVHGGAVPAHSVSAVGYEDRRALAADAKIRIAEAAAAQIPENCSLFINVGTTTEQVARALYEHRGLVVITNNINVINILSGSPGKDLILAGGVVRQSDGAIVGEAAVDFIRQFKVDIAVIGASALDTDGSILDFDYREVQVARAIIENARRTMLVADITKFDRTAPVRIGQVSQLDTMITDSPPPSRFAELCALSEVHLEIAEADPQEANTP